MSTAGKSSTASKASFWASWLLTGLVAFALSMSAFMKLTHGKPLVDGFKEFGIDLKLAVPIGIVEVVCLVLYLVPQTSVLGAILLTGYLGGAVATHVRAQDGQFAPPIVLGILVWLSLALRDPRLWQLIPFRKPPQ